MRRIATALGLLLLMSVPAFAQKEFEPTAAERRTIGDCIDKTAGFRTRANEQMHWPCGRHLPQRAQFQHLHHRRLQYARAEDLGGNLQLLWYRPLACDTERQDYRARARAQGVGLGHYESPLEGLLFLAPIGSPQ